MSTDENQVFLALQEWYQSDTYNLYQSDPPGVYYSMVLENVRSTKQPEENVLIDILEVREDKGRKDICVGEGCWRKELASIFSHPVSHSVSLV